MTARPANQDLDGLVGVQEPLERLPSLLRPGEEVLVSAGGFLEGHTGLLVATSQRVLFLWKDQAPIDVDYDAIVSFRARRGLVAVDLEIEDAQGPALVKQVHPRRRLVEFARLLGSRANVGPAR